MPCASVLLIYRWLIKQNFSMKISFGTAVIFLLSGPMIFHSYNQIMFVNYMPFLCLAFMSVDRYFEDVKKRKSGCLILSMFLMIMTSFYFSIGGLLAIVIYGIYRFFRMCDTYRERVTVKYFFQEGIRFAVCIIISILMSAVFAYSGSNGACRKRRKYGCFGSGGYAPACHAGCQIPL